MILRWSHLVPFSFVLLAATAAAGTPPDGVSLVRLAAPVFGSEVVSPEQERGAPCSLLAMDLDGNAVPDLVIGERLESGGRVAVYLGDARNFPIDGSGNSFFLPVGSVELSFGPELMAAGDFDADGVQDVVVGSRGRAALELFSGDGRGALRRSSTIALPGRLDALAVGEVNRRDGLADLVVATTENGRSSLAVYESPRGAALAEPELFDLPRPAAAIALGRLDDEPGFDVAVAAGTELVLLQGRDRRLTSSERSRLTVGAPRIDRVAFAEELLALAVGRVARRCPQLIALTSSGRVQLVSRHDAPDWEVSPTGLELAIADRGDVRLFAASLSSLARQDLVLAQGDSTLVVANLLQTPNEIRKLGRRSLLEEVRSSASVVQALALRLNGDALQDLVVLTADDPRPKLYLSAPITTFRVNSADDVADAAGCDSTHCSLREAILAANASPGADAIEFSLAVPTVSPLAPLPEITEAVEIDGRKGSPPFVVETTRISGSSCAGNECDGFTLAEDGSGLSLSNLEIIGFPDDGIRLRGDESFVTSCLVGLKVDDTVAANEGSGIVIQGSDNVVGGAESERNYISGNHQFGVHIFGSLTSFTSDNSIRGNFIGTDTSGALARGNGWSGVYVAASDNNIIGNSVAPNVISGNSIDGVHIADHHAVSTHSNLVMKNFIGVAADGESALGNHGHGVSVDDNLNTVGGTTPGHRNIISGNWQNGVHVGVESDASVVQGNYIGTTADGSGELGNADSGVWVDAGGTTVVGGSVAGAGNLVSGNEGSYAVAVTDDAELTEVLGNLVGTDASGLACLGNDGFGVFVNVGGTTVGAPDGRNVVACNAYQGIVLLKEAGLVDVSDITVQNNYVGVGVDGTTELGNGDAGIAVRGNVSSSLIGGEEITRHNLVANNGGAGILVASEFGNAPAAIRIAGNRIWGNDGLGVDLVADDGLSGVSANDSGDGDGGPNGLQNHPVITGYDQESSVVSFSLDSTASMEFKIEFFASTQCDPSGYGEGERVLGSGSLSTDAAGQGAGSLSIEPLSGWFLSARATDMDGNASEFLTVLSRRRRAERDLRRRLRNRRSALLDEQLSAAFCSR
jgi:CSLREA domain-containing protein